jgi:hypothetical protein
LAQQGGDLAGQRCRTLLTPLAQDADVAAGAEVDVAEVQADELGDAHPGLDHQRQQGTVTAAEPGAAVGRAK